MAEQQEPECIICLQEIDPQDSTPVFRLSCLHVFHTECISRWFVENNSRTCPLCRSHEHPHQVVPAAYPILFTFFLVAVISAVLVVRGRRY